MSDALLAALRGPEFRERRARTRAAELVARAKSRAKGAGIPFNLGTDDVAARLLAADCPSRKAQSIYDLCQVHYPELPTLFPRRR